MARDWPDYYALNHTQLEDWNQPAEGKRCRHGFSYHERCRGCRRTRTGHVRYECRGCRAMFLSHQVRDPRAFLCEACYGVLKTALERKDGPAPPVRYSGVPVDGDRTYTNVHSGEEYKEAVLQENEKKDQVTYFIDFGFQAEAPALIENRRIFERHMSALKDDFLEMARAKLAALGMGRVDVVHWGTSGRWASRITRQYEVYEVLPSGAERLADGGRRNRKESEIFAAGSAKFTGLHHRIRPVLLFSGDYRQARETRPHDEQCEVNPDGDVIWRRRTSELPGAQEPDEDESSVRRVRDEFE